MWQNYCLKGLLTFWVTFTAWQVHANLCIEAFKNPGALHRIHLDSVHLYQEKSLFVFGIPSGRVRLLESELESLYGFLNQVHQSRYSKNKYLLFGLKRLDYSENPVDGFLSDFASRSQDRSILDRLEDIIDRDSKIALESLSKYVEFLRQKQARGELADHERFQKDWQIPLLQTTVDLLSIGVTHKLVVKRTEVHYYPKEAVYFYPIEGWHMDPGFTLSRAIDGSNTLIKDVKVTEKPEAFFFGQNIYHNSPGVTWGESRILLVRFFDVVPL